jgi:hypothetical protein
MFKLCLALCVVATFATEAPVISLELDSSIRKLNTRSHYKAENKAKATGQGYTHECPANDAKASSRCKLPKASAYDHHDKLDETDIKRTVMRVEMGPKGSKSTACKSNCVCKDTESTRSHKCDKFIDFKSRGTYAVDYKLCDRSGNCAEDVVFAVILDDKSAPKFSFGKVSRKFTQECRKGSTMIPMPYVYDNVDTPAQIRSTLRINGAKSMKQYLRSYKVSTTYRYTINDFAGIFGKNSKVQGNTATTTRVFTVKDTLRPLIAKPTLKNVECKKGKIYTVPTTTCSDKCDDTKSVKADAGAIAATKVTTTKVTYNCKDRAGHSAYPVRTNVKIVDTTPPAIKVNMAYNTFKSSGSWDGQIFTHHGGSIHQGFAPNGKHRDQRPIFSCGDTCCATKSIVETHGWVKSCSDHTKAHWSEIKPGTYYHKFTCTDCNKLTTHGCRTVVNVDKHVPIITVLDGKDANVPARPTLQKINTVEATHDKNYVDGGATCSDMVDGVISQDVDISGDVVNMAKTGTYKITYKCCDVAGNCAKPAQRDVRVVDTTCPTCKLNTATPSHVIREASFAYKDSGATCTDSLDGSKKVVASGKKVDPELTGKYFITYSATDKAGNSNTKKASSKKCGNTLVRSVTVKDTLKPVIALHFAGKKIHESAAADKGVNNQRNPAQDKFMAQASSVNGWILGAAASLVAGVALMAVGAKKTAVSVPV